MARTGGLTRQRILDAALELFCARGFHATGIVPLAEKAGVSSAALYWHFPSKDAILAALLSPLVDAVDGVLVSHKRSGRGDPRILLGDYLGVLTAHRQLLCFLVSDPAVRQHPEIGPRLDAQQADVQAILAGRRPSAQAIAAAAAAMGAVWRPVVALDKDHLRRSSSTIVDAAVRALGVGARLA